MPIFSTRVYDTFRKAGEFTESPETVRSSPESTPQKKEETNDNIVQATSSKTDSTPEDPKDDKTTTFRFWKVTPTTTSSTSTTIISINDAIAQVLQ